MYQLRRMARRVGGDEGFTLIELTVTIVILGIVMLAFAGVLIQYLKVSGATRTRLSESTDQQFVSAYFQQDVSSLGVHGFLPALTNGNQFPTQQSVWTGSAPAGVPSGCVTGLPGSVVVGFAWNDYPGTTDATTTWNATPNAAVYVAQQVGPQWRLTRVRCIGGTTTSNVVAYKLTQAPTVACVTAGGASDSGCTASASTSPPQSVSMTIVVRDLSAPVVTGYTTTLTAQRRQG
jgi:prepilin-type N-terminal cleavage/methylation domain-containing protein